MYTVLIEIIRTLNKCMIGASWNTQMKYMY